MSTSLDQVHDLSLALFAGYPVIAVAYYAARTAPDASRSEPEGPRLLPIPERWAKGTRRRLLEIVGRSSHNRNRFDFVNSTARLDASFRLSGDIAILLWFVPGLAASTLAFLFGTDPDSGLALPRTLAAIALVMFFGAVGSLVIFATETTVFSSRDDAYAFDALARSFVLTNLVGAIVFVVAVLFAVGVFSPS